MLIFLVVLLFAGGPLFEMSQVIAGKNQLTPIDVHNAMGAALLMVGAISTVIWYRNTSGIITDAISVVGLMVSVAYLLDSQHLI